MTESPQVICSCGATEVHATAPDRCVRGHVLVGNETALKHGVRRFEATGQAPAAVQQTVDAFREAVIADRGGASELSTLDSAYIRRLAEAETLARLLAADLATRGIFTPKGRVRNTFQRWTEIVGLWDRLCQRVGTDRRAKAVASLREYLQEQPSEVPSDDQH